MLPLHLRLAIIIVLSMLSPRHGLRGLLRARFPPVSATRPADARMQALRDAVCRLSNIRMWMSTSADSAAAATAAAVTVICKSDGDIEALGAKLSLISSRGDVLLLRGDLGAGKTTLARGLIRCKFGEPGMRVTSPSYLLDNTYVYIEGQGGFDLIDGSENADTILEADGRPLAKAGQVEGDSENVNDQEKEESGVKDEEEEEDEDEEEDAVEIHHMDLYRMPTGCDLTLLNIPAIFSSCLCLVEWPERMGTNLPPDYLDVQMRISADESRAITLTPHSQRWRRKLIRLFAES